jgi:hypothetical protein
VAPPGGAVATCQPPPAAPSPGPADNPAACDAATETVRAPAAPHRRPAGPWWKGVSWCLALIFAERALAAQAAERVSVRLRRRAGE